MEDLSSLEGGDQTSPAPAGLSRLQNSTTFTKKPATQGLARFAASHRAPQQRPFAFYIEHRTRDLRQKFIKQTINGKKVKGVYMVGTGLSWILT